MKKFMCWSSEQTEDAAVEIEHFDAECAASEWCDKTHDDGSLDPNDADDLEIHVRNVETGELVKCSVTVDWSPVFSASELVEPE